MAVMVHSHLSQMTAKFQGTVCTVTYLPFSQHSPVRHPLYILLCFIYRQTFKCIDDQCQAAALGLASPAAAVAIPICFKCHLATVQTTVGPAGLLTALHRAWAGQTSECHRHQHQMSCDKKQFHICLRPRDESLAIAGAGSHICHLLFIGHQLGVPSCHSSESLLAICQNCQGNSTFIIQFIVTNRIKSRRQRLAGLLIAWEGLLHSKK